MRRKTDLPTPWVDWIARAERELHETATAARECGSPILSMEALLVELRYLRAGWPTWQHDLSARADNDDAPPFMRA